MEVEGSLKRKRVEEEESEDVSEDEDDSFKPRRRRNTKHGKEEYASDSGVEESDDDEEDGEGGSENKERNGEDEDEEERETWRQQAEQSRRKKRKLAAKNAGVEGLSESEEEEEDYLGEQEFTIQQQVCIQCIFAGIGCTQCFAEFWVLSPSVPRLIIERVVCCVLMPSRSGVGRDFSPEIWAYCFVFAEIWLYSHRVQEEHGEKLEPFNLDEEIQDRVINMEKGSVRSSLHPFLFSVCNCVLTPWRLIQFSERILTKRGYKITIKISKTIVNLLTGWLSWKKSSKSRKTIWTQSLKNSRTCRSWSY